jgi:hypothetical protein
LVWKPDKPGKGLDFIGKQINLVGEISDGAQCIADRELSRSTVEDHFKGRNYTKDNFGKQAEI